MKFPPKLSPGDKVSIISPASKIDRQIAERAAEILQQQGFRVEIGMHAFDKDGMFAGSDIDRAADMQRALNDKSIKAIFFTRGGYGSIRTHLHLNCCLLYTSPSPR